MPTDICRERLKVVDRGKNFVEAIGENQSRKLTVNLMYIILMEVKFCVLDNYLAIGVRRDYIICNY